MLAKPQSITAPLLLFLLDYYIENKKKRKIAVYIFNKILFIAIIAIFIVINIHFGCGNDNQIIYHKPVDAAFIGAFNYIFYIYKLFAPFNLAAYYPSPLERIQSGALEYYAIIAGCAALLIVALICARYSRRFMFGFVFYTVTLAPTLHIITIGKIITADRYAYIPYIGLFYIIAELLVEFCRRRSKSTEYSTLKLKKNSLFHYILLPVTSMTAISKFKYVCVCSFVCVCLLLVHLTHKRCVVWSNSFTLWSDVINKFPKRSEAYIGRGLASAAKNNIDAAICDYSTALAIDAHNYLAFYNRAIAYSAKFDFARAIDDCDSTVAVMPDYAPAYNLKASVLMLNGQYLRAIEYLKKALAINPMLFNANYNLSVAYLNLNDFIKAEYYIACALLIEPDNSNVFNLRDIIIKKSGAAHF